MLRAVLLFVNVAVSVVIPLWITRKTDVFTPGEGYIFGALLFIGATILELLVMSTKAYEKQKEQSRLWETRDLIDARFNELRRLSHTVEEERVGPKDLFSMYFGQKLADIETKLRSAASHREVRIDEIMLEVTDWLVECSFNGQGDGIFRAVHFTSDNKFFVGIHGRRYFENMYRLVKERRVREVRRLVVYDSPEDGDDPITKRILAFHCRQKHYDCRILSKAEFRGFVRDFHLTHAGKDFGIYGAAYLYKGEVATTDDIAGTYSRDQTEIERYTKCFDQCWAAGAKPTAEASAGPVTLDWLFTGLVTT